MAALASLCPACDSFSADFASHVATGECESIRRVRAAEAERYLDGLIAAVASTEVSTTLALDPVTDRFARRWFACAIASFAAQKRMLCAGNYRRPVQAQWDSTVMARCVEERRSHLRFEAESRLSRTQGANVELRTAELVKEVRNKGVLADRVVALVGAVRPCDRFPFVVV